MENTNLEAAIAHMEYRMAELENAVALLAYHLETVKEDARKWDGPDLFTKEGE